MENEIKIVNQVEHIEPDEWYSTKEIDKLDASFNIIFGERSNGKTFALLDKSLENFFTKNGEQFAYIRRFDTEIKQRQMRNLFNGIRKEKRVEFWSNGEYDSVGYYSGEFFITNSENDRKKKTIGYAFALNTYERDKGARFEEVTTIIFDEFMTRNRELPNEFVLFENVIKTILGNRTNAKVYLLANTVSRTTSYFEEFGVYNAWKMQQGTIELYKYGEAKQKTAVEFCYNTAKNSESNETFFAFNNPQLDMIKSGVWEMEIYPHIKKTIEKDEIINKFYVNFKQYRLQINLVVRNNGTTFCYAHNYKYNEFPDDRIIFDMNADENPLVQKSMFKTEFPAVKTIAKLYNLDKWFYSTNEVGEAVRSWIKESSTIGL